MSTLHALSTKELQALLQVYRFELDDLNRQRHQKTQFLNNPQGKPTGAAATQELKERLQHEEQMLNQLAESNAREELVKAQQKIVKELQFAVRLGGYGTDSLTPLNELLTHYYLETFASGMRLLKARMTEVKVELGKREG